MLGEMRTASTASVALSPDSWPRYHQALAPAQSGGSTNEEIRALVAERISPVHFAFRRCWGQSLT